MPFDTYVLQYMPDGSERVLTPLGLGSTPVLPIPGWSEREYKPVFLSKTSDRIAFSLAAVTILYLLCWLAWLIRHWHHPLIRVRDPLFSALSLCGLCLLVASNFNATFLQTDLDCALAPRLMMWGVTLGFAPLVLKNLRIWSLWHNRSNTFAPAPIKQWHLGVALVGLMLVDSAINLAWLLDTGMHAYRVSPDPQRPALDYFECRPFTSGLPYVLAHIIWKAVCLAAAMYLAYLLRDVSSAFSESRTVSLCVYNVIIVLACFFSVVATNPAGHEGTLLARNFLLIFLALATSSITCIPKCMAVRASEAKRMEQEAVNKAITAVYTPEQQDEDTLLTQDQSPPHQRQVQPTPESPDAQAHAVAVPVDRSVVDPLAAVADLPSPGVFFQSSIGGNVVARHPVHPAASLHPSPFIAPDRMGATRPPPSVRIQPRAGELHVEMVSMHPLPQLHPPLPLLLPPIPHSNSPTNVSSVDAADPSPSMLGESRDLLEELTSDELRVLHSTLVQRATRQRETGDARTRMVSGAVSSGSPASTPSAAPPPPSRQQSDSTVVVVHCD